MSQELRYYRVGLFVLLGVGLLVSAVLVVGGTDLFQRTIYFESYFDESVQGLEVGSPVKLRGVQIGSIADISFVSDHYELGSAKDELAYGQLVYVRMKTAETGDDAALDPDPGRSRREGLQKLVDRGLRLKIAQQGVTGTAYLEADYWDPEQNPPMKIVWNPHKLYVPSAPSTLRAISNAVERLFARLEKTPVEEVVSHFDELLVNVNATVEALDMPVLQGEVRTLVADLRETSAATRQAVDGLEVEQVSARLRGTLDEAQATLAVVRDAVEFGRPGFEAMIDNLRVVSEDLRDVAALARKYPSVLLLGEPPPQADPARSR